MSEFVNYARVYNPMYDNEVYLHSLQKSEVVAFRHALSCWRTKYMLRIDSDAYEAMIENHLQIVEELVWAFLIQQTQVSGRSSVTSANASTSR